MTTPTPLAAVVARLRRVIEAGELMRDIPPDNEANVSLDTLRTLLRCAERCEAIDGSAGELLKDMRAGMAYFKDQHPCAEVSWRHLAIILDAAAERTAAQDRVRELEGAMLKVRELVEDEANTTLHPDAQMYQRTLLARDIVEALGPIADPTQGVRAVTSREVEEALLRRAKRDARPSFIPADASAERLPSGLWCWAESGAVMIEQSNPEEGDHWYVNKESDTLEKAYLVNRVCLPDFLAARALGVKWLGWEK